MLADTNSGWRVGGSWKISESIWVRDNVDESHTCKVMPCAHLPAAGMRLCLDLVFAASAVKVNQSSGPLGEQLETQVERRAPVLKWQG